VSSGYNPVVSELSAVTSVGHIFRTIPDLATPEQVQASLREILDDDTLAMFWWDWEHERYVDVHGQPATLDRSPSQVVTLVEYETRKVGAITHDARLLERPEFLDAFVPTMRIAMERDRLHRDLVSKLEQLRASRQRIVEAADAERRRLGRNLHDGAQQRLVVLLLGLRRLEERVRDDQELGPLVRNAREEAEGAIADVRELARGLHPPLLEQHGLVAAVRAGAARSPLPIELDLRTERRLPPAVEAAAYYVCAEAVTNAAKHAEASSVRVTIADGDGTLLVEICDDGVGGAVERESDSTGLCGLRDRVEALEGRLEIESPPGCGTRLTAVFPLPA
jgi:signal transduction histidine kinase